MVMDNEALPDSGIDELVEGGFTGDIQVNGNLTP